MFSKILKLLIVQILVFSLSSILTPLKSYTDQTTLKPTLSKKRLIKILSIDGGGVRGIIPALMLGELERKLEGKKHLSNCFDIMAGTSAGGILVLLLNVPDDKGKPKYSAHQIIQLYHNFGTRVFHKSFWHDLISLNGWFGVKYSESVLEEKLLDFFGQAKLKETVTNVIIPAYDISDDETIFFRTQKALADQTYNFYLRDIARATSAAPTYFKPAIVQDLTHHKEYHLIDGGVAAVNNPTMSALVYALKLFGKDNDFLIVSLGTGTNYGAQPGKLSFKNQNIKSGGKVDWAHEIVPIMMYAANDVVDYQISEIFVGDGNSRKYYRFQVLLDAKHTGMDDTSSENTQALTSYAMEFIQMHQKEFKFIADKLLH